MPQEPAPTAPRTTSLPLNDVQDYQRIAGAVRRFAEEAGAQAGQQQAFSALAEEQARKVQRLSRESASLHLSARGMELSLSWEALGVRLPALPQDPARAAPAQNLTKTLMPLSRPVVPAAPAQPAPEVRVQLRGFCWLQAPVVQAILVERPHPRETLSGDAALIERHGQLLRIAVVDGLGHGPAAREAALRTASSLTSTWRDELQDSVLAAHDLVAATRGATLGVADIDLAARSVRATTIGNVRVALFFGPGRTWSPCGTDAVLGHGRGTLHGRLAVRVEQHALPPDGIFALFSDGLQNQLRPPLQRVGELLEMGLLLFATYAVPNDDSTLLLVSCA
jgi:hypothetical protein